MDYTQLIEWEFTDDNKLIGKYNMCYILIRKLNNNNPYELRIFNKGDIVILHSFPSLPAAARYAFDVVSEIDKPEIKEEINNIVYIKDWREYHGIKE